MYTDPAVTVTRSAVVSALSLATEDVDDPGELLETMFREQLVRPFPDESDEDLFERRAALAMRVLRGGIITDARASAQIA